MTKRTEVPSVNDVPEPRWVGDMREHFRRHGSYRQTDLDHVLGKPWDTVTLDASGRLELACRAADSRPQRKVTKKIARKK